MKAFALAAAVLLLAGSAAALCTDTANAALNCATCVSTTDVCATCLADVAGTAVVEVPVAGSTSGEVECILADACIASAAVPGCVADTATANQPCDSVDPRLCAVCDTTNGYTSVAVDGGCVCNADAGFSAGTSGGCVCADGFVNPIVDATTTPPTLLGECISDTACTTSDNPAFVAGCNQCNPDDPRQCDLCTDDSTPVENVCPTAPPCTETVPGCATCNTDNTCATCDTTKFWQETPQEGACVCQDGYEPSSVPGAGACVPVTPTDCNSIPGCNQCDADDNSICAACDIANKFKPTPVDNECECDGEHRVIEGSACVCDAENGWSEVDGVCACAAEGFTLVGTDCVANNACLDDTSLNCAPNTAVTPAQDCSATDPRKCAACAAGFEFDAVTETCSSNACIDPRCLPSQCPVSPNVCEQCVDGFVPINGECVQDGCLVEHCTECVIDPSTGLPGLTCEVCSRGYQLAEDGSGRCVPLPPPTPDCDVEACRQCMPGKTDMCETCIKGFELDYDFKCHPFRRGGRCQRRFPGCVRCGKNDRRCLRCGKGRRLVKGRCLKARRPRHCKKGFRLVKGRCVRPRKVVCKKGYRLVKGRCVRPKRG